MTVYEVKPEAAPVGPAPFRFHRAADLIAGVKPTDWLFRDVLAQGILAVLYGEPESAKSFLALDWGLSTASARAWAGFECDAPGMAVIIAGEGHGGYARRLAAWQAVRGDLGAVPLLISATAAALSDPLEAAAVSDAIAEESRTSGLPVRLIVVDTLARCLGADENSNTDVSRFVANLDRHLRERFGATVVVVHHVGAMAKDRARGATALRGAADAEFSVVREGNTITLTATKAKDHARPSPLGFELCVVDLPVSDGRGTALTSCVLRPLGVVQAPATDGMSPRQREALAVLAELYADHRQRLTDGGQDPAGARVRIDDWRDGMRDRGFTDRRRWPELVAGLARRGAVRIVEPYVYLGGVR